MEAGRPGRRQLPQSGEVVAVWNGMIAVGGRGTPCFVDLDRKFWTGYILTVFSVFQKDHKHRLSGGLGKERQQSPLTA
jgi:hypothetical protein